MTRWHAWGMRARAAALFVVVVLADGCSASVPPAGPSSSRPLRVLVYNIHAGKDAAGRDNLERVAALVRDLEVDLALLQEVDRRTRRSGGVDQPAVLAQLTRLHAAFGKSLDYDGGEYGIALLSRWPIVDDGVASLPVQPPQERAGGSYEPRAALSGTIHSPAGRLAVVNTHLDASRDDRWRAQEIRTVLAIANAALARGDAHVLVGGDLNSTPESSVQAQVRAAGWRDVWTECGSGAGHTYPADSGTKRIDYLYLSGTVRCDSATVPDTQASDHRPLLVLVRVR